MKKAVFLDRDGVLNRERGMHTWTLDDFEILPQVPRALKLLQDEGYLLVVITNQSGIGLGLYGHPEVAVLHGYLHSMLAEHGVHLSGIHYCPHHPSQGKCLCRKPGSSMFERAIALSNIDVTRSVMIGDRTRDMEAAAAVGVRGVLIDPNTSMIPMLQNQVLNG